MPGAQRRRKTLLDDTNTFNVWLKLVENSPFATMAVLSSPRRPSTSPSTFRSSTPVVPNGVPTSPEADKVSKMIDEELKKQATIMKEARKRDVKVLLLGQAESGKSTLRKQFQLYYASHSLDSELPAWRPVVYFNVIKAIRMILDELDYEFLNHTPEDEANGDYPLSKKVQALISPIRHKVLPLVAMEGPVASELSGGTSYNAGIIGAVRHGKPKQLVEAETLQLSEVNALQLSPSIITNCARTLNTVVEDIKTLWTHPAVRYLLKSSKLKLGDCAAHFLDNIHRIAQPDYLPTKEDLLCVRLQTLGVVENSFPVRAAGISYDWKLYDVGGARNQRHVWASYFDDAEAIIFLAPMSAFDQYLDEDPLINRVQDSLMLFGAVCANPLLKKAHLVLLLNKADLLKAKLAAGLLVKTYVTSYGERNNDYETVAEYFRTHFTQMHKSNDTAGRSLYVHFTSMLDIRATQGIITDVGDAILRKHISDAGLV